MIELVGDPSHPFADCGCRRGSRQRMQNKIKKQPFATTEVAAMLPPCFCRAIRLTFLSLVDAVSLCFCFMLAFSRLSFLFSRLSSLFSRCCSFLRSHFELVTSNFASGHRMRSQLPRPFAAPLLFLSLFNIIFSIKPGAHVAPIRGLRLPSREPTADAT